MISTPATASVPTAPATASVPTAHATASVLGIDVSKATLTCTLLDSQTRKPLWRREVKNTSAGWKQLLKHAPAGAAWVLEPTGRYSEGVARQARAAGRDVRLAQPRAAMFFLKGMQNRAKTDKLDSAGLALYGACCSLKPFPLKSEMHDELDQLLLARKGLSQSLKEWNARKRDLPRAAVALEPAIAMLKSQIKQLDSQIEALTQTPEAKDELWAIQELQKVPGIGPIVASSVVSRLTAKSFAHSDQFVAYCGLDIRVKQSGEKEVRLKLTKQGDAELRRLLYIAAKASITANESPFKAQYEREQAKGLSKTAALCSIARKIARLSWAIVKNKANYNPERIFDQSQIQGQKLPQIQTNDLT